MLGERLLQGTQRPALDLTLLSDADPMTRLNASRDKVLDWLSRHEVYVRANSGAPSDPPPTRPKSTAQTPVSAFGDLTSWSGEVGGTWLGRLYANPEDRAEFERRVTTYLSKLRNGVLVDNVIADIVRGDHNKVGISVGNLTDDSVSGVQLTVIVPKGGLFVFTTSGAKPLPALPKWPNVGDHMARMAVAAPPLSHWDLSNPSAGSVAELNDAYEITWDLGDIRPQDWSEPVEFTLIAGPKASDNVEIEIVARAKDRRGIRTENATLTVLPDEWTVDDFYVAHPSG